VAFEHDGSGVTGFALYAEPQQGKVVRIDLGLVPAGEGGVRSAPLPRLPEGAYTLSIAAYNPLGESTRVAAFPSRVTVKKSDGRTFPSNEAVGAGTDASGERVKASPSPPKAEVTSERDGRSGPLGRLWRVIVGD
jgi:hypothetical protein